MSNSSLSANQLCITQLSLTGEGAWPDLLVEKLSPRLNVFCGPPQTGKSSVAQLVGHLMYGKSESPWRREFGQTISTAAGSIQLDGPQGGFVLRRHYNENRQSRLTISSGRGDAADGQMIQNLLSGLSPQLAAKVYLVDFAESPRADWLLSESFAREFSSSRPVKTSRSTSRPDSRCAPGASNIVDRVDQRRIDELVKRRDVIAGEIQQQMALRRSESAVLEREINELDSNLESQRERVEHLRANLHGVDVEIAELETQLRYFSLDRYAKHYGQHLNVEQQQRELAALDEEITGCRHTLAEILQRENLLRTELTQCGSDGTADSVTCLADGRATLGSLEQLLDDLDAEVSQLARANQPGRSLGHDSHAKLSPVAALLRQQVYTLCGQITEQERIVRRQQLTAESRQLARVHTELGERLDLLLSRRESLVQQAQLASQPPQLVPQPPAADHCHCEHHGEFVQLADAMVLGRADRGRFESEARDKLGVLQNKRTQLVNELNALQCDLNQLETRWEQLQHERASILSGKSIEDQQAELDRLESVIRQSLQIKESQIPASSVGIWRASDVLAQLTNGHLVQIRLERDQSLATIIDRHAQARTLESLANGEHDQVYLALTLALVSSYAQRGVQLPLILDEPFLQQDTAQTAAMVGVLEEFARAGHQVLVFTEDRNAQRRFSTLSAALFDLVALRQTGVAHTVPTKQTEPAPTFQTTSTRIIRETFDGHSTPVLRLATVDGDPQHDEAFFLTENSTFNDFPVLGGETSALFRRFDIYSVGDLLAADATEIARQLNLKGITAETVCLWQTHMGLMCHVPNVTLDDAQVLAASGIDLPSDLFDVDIDALLPSIEVFLQSARGRRFQRLLGRYSRSRLDDWQTAARNYRDRWQRASQRYSDWQSHKTDRSDDSSQSESKRESNRPRRFYLSLQQDVEEAPSIGPKTAKRLAKVGIRTVADLLNADPDSAAAELDVSHISAAKLTAWQHQARLVCQIPGLRGYGAQLLVACGMTEPDQIAKTSAEQLVTQILSLCETKEGQRILRSSDPPESEKIAKWVGLAMQSRPLEAA